MCPNFKKTISIRRIKSAFHFMVFRKYISTFKKLHFGPRRLQLQVLVLSCFYTECVTKICYTEHLYLLLLSSAYILKFLFYFNRLTLRKKILMYMFVHFVYGSYFISVSHFFRLYEREGYILVKPTSESPLANRA